MRTNFIIFGDSITYGAWDKEKGGWANRLRLAYDLEVNEHRYNFFNLGISGEVSQEILARFDGECSARVKPDEHTLIIIAVGINDAQIDDGNERVSFVEFEATITALMKKAKAYTDDVLFLGLTNVDESKVCPIPWHPTKFYYNERIQLFDAIIQKNALKHNVHYLPLFNSLNLDELSDGLHPNEIGHEKMYQIIKKETDEML